MRTLLLGFLLPSLLAFPDTLELVDNGGLEKGSGRSPDGWACLDHITSRWGTEGHPGRCLECHTEVLQKDKKAFLADEQSQKAPGKGGIYDVVGAHEGAWAYPPPIDLSPEDSCFIVSVDVQAPAPSTELMYPMLLIRGFQKVTEDKAGADSSWFHTYHENGPAYSDTFGPDKFRRKSMAGDYLQVYRHSLACRCSSAGKWEHFEMGFRLPARAKFRPERLLLKAYAYWPAGIYRFDNLSLRRASPEEMQKVNARRKSIQESIQ